MAQDQATDWEGVEREYRAGILSVREIGTHFGVSHTAINKRAKKADWSRDLGAKIRAKAEALVSKDAVSTEVSTAGKVSEKDIVEANAMVVAAVDRRHKRTAGKGQALIDRLLAEIEAVTESPELYEQLGEMLDETRTTESGRVIEDKLNKLYRAVISIDGRVDSVKKLSDAFDKFAKFERTAYKLEDVPPPVSEDLTPERMSEGARRIAFMLHREAVKPA